MGDPGDEDKPREHRVVTREDTTDHALLPRRFDMLAGEVRSLASIIERKVVPALTRIIDRLDEDSVSIRNHEAELRGLRDRVDDIHMQVTVMAGGR